ncbi:MULTISPECIES: hypothetical protein [unclassified Streptomyces]|uniref:hypothetical protein n=1 Tax=unclassified Streptomyces TaxID=2593676 RepID=UPI0033274CE4
MRRQPRTTVNRCVLTIAGLALALVGCWLATARTPAAAELPAGWPVPPADGVLLDRGYLATLRARGWWTPTVIAAGVLITLLLSRWLLSQLHVRGASRLPLTAPGGTLHTHALEQVLTERATSIDGVVACRVHIHARRLHLQLYIHAWLNPGATPEAVVRALTAVTTEAERTVSPYTLQTRVRLSNRTHRMPHVH